MMSVSGASFVILSAGILSCALAFNIRFHKDWEGWKQKYGKFYNSQKREIVHRRIWERNYNMVESHNNRVDATFKMEMNQFADNDLKSKPSHVMPSLYSNDVASKPDTTIPTSWDWREKGAITPVRNQGMVGSAAAIVTAEELESYSFIQTGEIESVSYYEVNDCCVKGGSTGSFYYDFFKCIHNIGGVCSKADYPISQGSCKNKTCKPTVEVNGGAQVPKGDEEAMMARVFKIPVMSAIDASHASFQMYASGIYSEPDCSSERLDHVIQVVGYGTMNGQDFWICKNSWGASWGMKGYVLIARNKGNMCGISTQAYYPV